MRAASISTLCRRRRISYRFIAHREFRKQHEAFVERNPDLVKALLTQYKKAMVNPTVGKIMHGIPLDELQGRLRILYVGSKKKHRFVYFFFPEQGVVLPAWLSPVPRNKLDYDKLEWLECADEYCDDLMQGNQDAFEDWSLLLSIHK